MSNHKCSYSRKETPEHLLLECTQYSDIRDKLSQIDEFQNLATSTRPNIRVLLGTSIGVKYAIRFIEETGISTRKWHLQRVEREEYAQNLDPFDL